MTIELYGSVALTHSLVTPREDGEGSIELPEGARGTVVMVYGDHEGYEVEFMEGEDTIAIVTLSPHDVRLAERIAP